MSALEAYISRFSTRSVPRLALESFAKELLIQGQTFMPYGQANRFLAKFNPDEVIAEQAQEEEEEQVSEPAGDQHLRRRKQNLQNQKVSLQRACNL